MKTMKITLLALAVSAAAVGTAQAQNVDRDITIDDTRNYETNITNTTTNTTTNTNTDVNLGLDATADLSLTAAADLYLRQSLDQSLTETTDRSLTETTDRSLTETVDLSLSDSVDRSLTDTTDRSLTETTDRSWTETRSLTDTTDRSLSEDRSLTETTERSTVDSRDTSYSDSYDRNVSVDEVTRNHSNVVFEDIQRTENVESDIRRERNEHGVAVNLEKDLSLSSDISFSGDPTLTGELDIDSAAISVIDSRQTITGNGALNERVDNEASMDGDAASSASGNLQFNVAAGDTNVQDNAAALSAADASFTFGMADAEIFVHQHGASNVTVNEGASNSAGVGDSAFANASGNIGVNVASGNHNAQSNNLSASVATAVYAQSSVATHQVASGNLVTNAASMVEDGEGGMMPVTLTGTATGTSTGSASGTYEGEGRHYLFGTGQGSLYNREEQEGTLAIGEIDSEYDLAIELTGSLPMASMAWRGTTNTASLSGDAFANASGNIGVNVAAGSGNLQSNSLSMAVAQPGAGN
ncbi:adhesin [Lysobacteraceae bacterium NML93-0399]|nr:adhesin [Xanthomonadaceae bacterium NML93-0399]